MGIELAAAGLIGGASIYGAKKSGDAAEDAARAQTEASKQGIEFQREALEALRQDLDPFRQFGMAALDPLSGLIGGGYGAGGSFQDSYRQQQIQSALAEQTALEADRGRVVETGGDILYGQDLSAALDDRARERLADYNRQKQLVEGLSPDDPSRFQQQQILESKELRLPIEALTTIDPVGSIAQERLSKYYAEKGVTPPSTLKPGRYTRELTPGVTQQGPATQQAGNALLQQAMQERAQFDPTGSPLLSRAAQERLDFDPLQNQLLQSAAERQMAMDPTQALGPEILQNPLLRALQDDVTRRLTANQAARGKLGSGGTAEALQQRLVPQAIQFGLQLNELQRQDISDRARLGGAQVGLQEAAMAGREGLGFGLSGLERQAISDRMQAGLTQEDLRQRQIANLMDAARMGQSSAAQVGGAGQSAASQMGQLALAGGQAQAAGALGQAQARNQMIGGLASAGLGLLGSFTPTSTIGSGMNTGITQGFTPTTGQFGQYLGF